MTAEEFNDRWQPERMIDALNGTIDEVLDILASNDLVRGTNHMLQVMPLFYQQKDDVYETYAGQLLRGSFNQALICVDYYLARITEEDKYEQAMEIVLDEFTIMAERMREICTKYLRVLSNGLELREEYLRGDDDDDGLTEEQKELVSIPIE